jgi:hypothetical protein
MAAPFDRRAYMRMWKQKEYTADPSKVKALNRSYYFKYKFGLSQEDTHLFGDLTPECSQAIHYLTVIQDKNPLLLRHILQRFQ